jgi:nucleoside-diphosphate-sugar epimerase
MPPAPRKEHCGPAWPASSWPPTKPATSRWSSAGPRTTSVPAAAPSRCWATGSSPAALAGKTATVLGDPDQPHTYTYLPDIGEGLATLGEHPEAPGEVWHLPNDPRTRTTRQLVEVIYRLAGQPKTKLRSTPALLLRALGVTNPTVRELLELQYEFQEPFIVDSTKIATKLEVHATPLDQALAGTLATYRTSPAS